jgi:transcriptional regulator with XRE-family HTH domain
MGITKLRQVRFFRGLRQIQLATISGVGQHRISAIENGYIEPRQSEKEKLAKSLGMEIGELFPEDQR